jgi:hypothetical protein
VYRRIEIEFFHHLDKFAARPRLQARIAFDLGPDGGMAAALIIMGGIDLQGRVQFQQPIEQAVIERVGIASGKVGAAGGADQKRIAGKDPVVGQHAHGIPGMAGGVQRLQPHPANPQNLAIGQAEIGIGRGRQRVCHHRCAQFQAQLLGRREMVGMGVGVQHIANAQALARRQAKIIVRLLQVGVDQHGGMAVAAAQKVRLASAGGDLLENHAASPK